MVRAVDDMVFKYIFGAEERRELLRSFVNLALGRAGLPTARQLWLRNPENLRQFVLDRGTLLDIKAMDEVGRAFDLEVQVERSSSFPERALYYWSRLYSSQIVRGQDYHELRPAIGIWVLDKVWNPEDRDFPKLFQVMKAGGSPIQREGTAPWNRGPFTEGLGLILLELPLVRQEPDCDKLEKWLQLMASEGEDERMARSLAELDRDFHEFDEAYQKFLADDELREYYEAREKYEMWQRTLRHDSYDEGKAEGRAEGNAEGRAAGKSEGLAEGKAEALAKIEASLRASGMSEEKIAAVLMSAQG